MTWPWLMGNPVQLLYFIAAVLGIPASVMAVVQIVSAVRKVTHSRAEGPALEPALVGMGGASANVTNLNRYCRECRPKGDSQLRPSPTVLAAYKRAVLECHRHPRAE